VIAVAVIGLLSWGFSSLSASAGTASVENGYQEFINGALISANVHVTTCHEDGSCVHEHNCDKYYVYHPAQYDSNGHETQAAYEEEKHHDCPYVTQEYTYSVTATYGFKTVDYPIPHGSHIFALHPSIWHSDPGSWFLDEGHHYHTSHGVPTGVPEGVPPAWKKYQGDIARGDSDPASDIHSYTNYILASQDSILKAYSPDVDRFLKQGILPEHTQNFRKGNPFTDLLDVNKMSFVGFTPSNAALWQKRLMRFNAALGMQLQGDMHIVAIDDHLIGAGQSETYANALKAYWQGPKMGKKALAKNGIIVVLGVNRSDNTISWARAATGMPVGNGEMVSAIEQRLPGNSFNPGAVLGKVVASVDPKTSNVNFNIGHGLLGQIVFHDFPFQRACMQCKQKTDHGTSFVYLKADIKQPGWAYALDVFLGVLAGLVALAAVVCTTPSFNSYMSNPRYGV